MQLTYLSVLLAVGKWPRLSSAGSLPPAWRRPPLMLVGAVALGHALLLRPTPPPTFAPAVAPAAKPAPVLVRNRLLDAFRADAGLRTSEFDPLPMRQVF